METSSKRELLQRNAMSRLTSPTKPIHNKDQCVRALSDALPEVTEHVLKLIAEFVPYREFPLEPSIWHVRELVRWCVQSTRSSSRLNFTISSSICSSPREETTIDGASSIAQRATEANRRTSTGSATAKGRRSPSRVWRAARWLAVTPASRGRLRYSSNPIQR